MTGMPVASGDDAALLERPLAKDEGAFLELVERHHAAYAEGALPFGDKLRCLMHVSMCKHCRLYVRQLRLTIRTVGSPPKPAEPPPPEVREALLKQFRNWKSKA